MTLLFEQLLNGLQYGVTLFLLAAGLTLVFGIMGLINLAHGSFYMIGAFVAAKLQVLTGSFLAALVGGSIAAAGIGLVVERIVLRKLYARDHLDQVLATFGLILFFNEAISMLFGRQPLLSEIPVYLTGSITLIEGVPYPLYRLAIIALGVLVALGLYLLIVHTRIGMLVRAGATNREMVRALGVRIDLLNALVFALGALLAGLAGTAMGPLLSVQVGMGDRVLISTFVVIVIGGIGSVRGALVGALLVGMVDTLARAFLPTMLRNVMAATDADSIGAGLASMAAMILMAVVLMLRPRGLFPAHG